MVARAKPEDQFWLLVYPAELELILLGVTTLLAHDDLEGDIFEPGFRELCVSLQQRLRARLLELGILGGESGCEGRRVQ